MFLCCFHGQVSAAAGAATDILWSSVSTYLVSVLVRKLLVPLVREFDFLVAKHYVQNIRSFSFSLSYRSQGYNGRHCFWKWRAVVLARLTFIFTATGSFSFHRCRWNDLRIFTRPCFIVLVSLRVSIKEQRLLAITFAFFRQYLDWFESKQAKCWECNRVLTVWAFWLDS